MNKDKFNPVQRNYKDTLFRMIFSDKEALLSLYNAISGKDYKGRKTTDFRISGSEVVL